MHFSVKPSPHLPTSFLLTPLLSPRQSCHSRDRFSKLVRSLVLLLPGRKNPFSLANLPRTQVEGRDECTQGRCMHIVQKTLPIPAEKDGESLWVNAAWAQSHTECHVLACHPEIELSSLGGSLLLLSATQAHTTHICADPQGTPAQSTPPLLRCLVSTDKADIWSCLLYNNSRHHTHDDAIDAGHDIFILTA